MEEEERKGQEEDVSEGRRERRLLDEFSLCSGSQQSMLWRGHANTLCINVQDSMRDVETAERASERAFGMPSTSGVLGRYFCSKGSLKRHLP